MNSLTLALLGAALRAVVPALAAEIDPDSRAGKILGVLSAILSRVNAESGGQHVFGAAPDALPEEPPYAWTPESVAAFADSR